MTWLALLAALLLIPVIVVSFFPATTTAGLRRLAGMKTRSVEIPGFRIAYMEGGKGELEEKKTALGRFGRKADIAKAREWAAPPARQLQPLDDRMTEATANKAEEVLLAAG